MEQEVLTIETFRTIMWMIGGILGVVLILIAAIFKTQQLSLRNDIKAVKDLVDKVEDSINEIKLLYELLKERQFSEKESDKKQFQEMETRLNNYSDRIKELERDVAIIKTKLNGKR